MAYAVVARTCLKLLCAEPDNGFFNRYFECGNQEGIAGACVDYARDESGKTECPKQSDSIHEYYAHTKRGNDLEFYCLYKVVLVTSIEEWVSWSGLCEAKGGRPIAMAVISVYGDAPRSL